MITEMCAEALEMMPTETLDDPYAHVDCDFQMGDMGHWSPFVTEFPNPDGTWSVYQQLWTMYPVWVSSEYKAYQRPGNAKNGLA